MREGLLERLWVACLASMVGTCHPSRQATRDAAASMQPVSATDARHLELPGRDSGSDTCRPLPEGTDPMPGIEAVCRALGRPLVLQEVPGSGNLIQQASCGERAWMVSMRFVADLTEAASLRRRLHLHPGSMLFATDPVSGFPTLQLTHRDTVVLHDPWGFQTILATELDRQAPRIAGTICGPVTVHEGVLADNSSSATPAREACLEALREARQALQAAFNLAMPDLPGQRGEAPRYLDATARPSCRRPEAARLRALATRLQRATCNCDNGLPEDLVAGSREGCYVEAREGHVELVPGCLGRAGVFLVEGRAPAECAACDDLWGSRRGLFAVSGTDTRLVVDLSLASGLLELMDLTGDGAEEVVYQRHEGFEGTMIDSPSWRGPSVLVSHLEEGGAIVDRRTLVPGVIGVSLPEGNALVVGTRIFIGGPEGPIEARSGFAALRRLLAPVAAHQALLERCNEMLYSRPARDFVPGRLDDGPARGVWEAAMSRCLLQLTDWKPQEATDAARSLAWARACDPGRPLAVPTTPDT